METLLRSDFAVHFGLPVSTTANIAINTAAQYFEIEDDVNRETRLHFAVGLGMAAYRNANTLTVNIINYDKFVTGLPHAFQQGKKRCDLIVHTTNRQYFLLNELKDRVPHSDVLTKASAQLLASLTLIMAVPSIAAFARSHNFLHCCFFNKQAMAPAIITAPTAFSRLGAVATGGLRMSHPGIEALGFEFWEYSGNQAYNLV